MVTNPFTGMTINASYFSECPRDEDGHCLPQNTPARAERVGEFPGVTYKTPPKIYHVTKSKLVPKILKEGLRPGTVFHDTLDGSPIVPRTYFFSDAQEAEQEGKGLIEDGDEDTTILEVDPSFTKDWEHDPNLEDPTSKYSTGEKDKVGFLSLRDRVPKKFIKRFK